MFTLSLLYGVIILVLAVGAFFIVYHILKYSLNEALGFFGSIFFGFIFIIFGFLNFLSFQALDATALFPAMELGPIAPNTLSPMLPSSKNNPW